MAPLAAVPVADHEEAVALLAERLLPGDVVLVKASRGVGLDRVVERLVALGGRGASG
jgi:UDP-N-acetylmuramoyl-tripeptide--D-alanyl-D-alanine ligase